MTPAQRSKFYPRVHYETNCALHFSPTYNTKPSIERRRTVALVWLDLVVYTKTRFWWAKIKDKIGLGSPSSIKRKKTPCSRRRQQQEDTGSYARWRYFTLPPNCTAIQSPLTRFCDVVYKKKVLWLLQSRLLLRMRLRIARSYSVTMVSTAKVVGSASSLFGLLLFS